MSNTRQFWPILAALTLTAACQPKPAPQTTALTIAHVTINVEIADTPATMQRGLMFRATLPADHGMLFVFEQPRRASFWMRNTSIPLTIAYLDAAGRILELHDLFPYDETPVPSHSANITYALEMNQGWFKKNHITPGMTISGTFFSRQ
ncbi:MAG: DUF192 domain-containing protein [Verrucomicrobiales bacterium]|jgi:uncharacterized membrane protein (UPF0127 family)|nr:DUF192 domain-containing protein [Verrucomicrobiales bacterium]